MRRATPLKVASRTEAMGSGSLSVLLLRRPASERVMARCSLRGKGRSPAHLAHALEDDGGVAIHAVGAAPERRRQNGGKARGLIAVEVRGSGAVPGARSGVGAVDGGSPLDDVEIE